MFLQNMFGIVSIGDVYLIGVHKFDFWFAAVSLALLTLGAMYLANIPQPVPNWGERG